MKNKNEVKGYADGIPVYCAHDAVVPVSEMRPNPKNPNTHPEEQLKRLGAIIRGAGWRNPITVSTRSGLIVRGHGRLAAAQMEGLTEVPVDYQNYASDAEELADLVADNRIAELADPDMQKLAEIFEEIVSSDTSIDMTGYTFSEYSEIADALSNAIDGLADPDDEITPPPETVSRLGDMWVLGGRQCIIWVKNAFVIGRQDYQWQHEPCLYGWKEGAHYFVKDRTQATVVEEEAVDYAKLKKQELIELLEKQRSGDEPTTVIRENKPIRNSMHPTMKPVPLLLRLIKNSSRRGEIVFDPFGGSGSTLIACEQADRVCYTMELDPKYVDVIVKRYMLVTGKDDVICIRDGRELSRREVSKLIQE